MSSSNVDDSLLQCSICLETVNDPVQCPRGHLFCRKCIHDYWDFQTPNDDTICPVDRIITNEYELSVNLIAKHLLDKQITSCKNQISDHDKCDWTGSCSKLNDHLLHSCEYSLVCCEKCGQDMFRKHQYDHYESKCPMASESCTRCGLFVQRKWMQLHLEEFCMFALKICPNKCFTILNNADTSIKIFKTRRKLLEHIRHECPLQIHDCPYASYGCQYRGTHEEIQTHKAKDFFQHIHVLTNPTRKENERLIKKVILNMYKVTNDFKSLQPIESNNDNNNDDVYFHSHEEHNMQQEQQRQYYHQVSFDSASILIPTTIVAITNLAPFWERSNLFSRMTRFSRKFTDTIGNQFMLYEVTCLENDNCENISFSNSGYQDIHRTRLVLRLVHRLSNRNIPVNLLGRVTFSTEHKYSQDFDVTFVSENNSAEIEEQTIVVGMPDVGFYELQFENAS